MNSKSEVVKSEAEVNDLTNSGIDESLKKVNAEFDKEVQINLDKDRLTYICDYCGKINKFDAAMCSRCGKRRPRNEYIKAMNAIKESKISKAEFDAEEAVKEAEYKKAETLVQEKKDNILAEREEAQKMTMVRLVEERVADEKQQMAIKEEARVDQEREFAKKMAAREAVLQIIAAEKSAEDVVAGTKKEATETIESQKKDYEKRIADEREKAITIAAERLVAERAGIEKVATEQISLNKQEAERIASERILTEREESEKMAARRAVLQIIAAEKSADDELRLNREALSRAALKRIEEEKDLAKKEAEAKLLAERQGLEKAAEERIRAERETINKLLQEKKAMDKNGYQSNIISYPNNDAQTRQIVQPFVIVPYVNAKQPLLQYKPNQIYRFVPNTYTEQMEAQERAKNDLKVMVEGPEPTDKEIEDILAKKLKEKETIEAEIKDLTVANNGSDKEVSKTKSGKARVRLISLFAFLLSVGIFAVLWFMPLIAKGTFASGNINLSILKGFLVLVQDGVNSIFGTSLAILGTNEYVEYIRGMDTMGGIILPLGLFIVIIAYLFLALGSLIKIFSGKARSKGLFLPILGFIFMLISVGGIYLPTKAAGINFINNIQISVYIFAGLSLLALVANICNKKNIS